MSILSRIVSFVRAHNSVEEITADFHSMLTSLNSLVTRKIAAAEKKLADALRLHEVAATEKAEAEKAQRVITKIESILS